MLSKITHIFYFSLWLLITPDLFCFLFSFLVLFPIHHIYRYNYVCSLSQAKEKSRLMSGFRIRFLTSPFIRSFHSRITVAVSYLSVLFFIANSPQQVFHFFIKVANTRIIILLIYHINVST